MYPTDLTTLTDITTLTNSQSIVTISFFKYTGKNIFWAFKEMGSSKKPLSEIPGLLFFKMMGSGGGDGLSIKPDFSVYAFLGVWKNSNYARNFFKSAKVFKGFKKHCKEWWTLFMSPLKSIGKWNKINPFLPVTTDQNYEGPIAVLTRATISFRHLINFWKAVPGVTGILKEQDGLIFYKGIGEYPIFQQATFSLWENKRAVQLFAYHSEQHKAVIKKTTETGWYNEDLFAEFKILSTEGNWQGIQLFLSQEKKRRGDAIHDLINQTLSDKTRDL